MAYEPKTKPTEVSVEEFIEEIQQPQKKEDAYALLSLFAEVTGEEAKMWGPSIIGFGKYHYRYAAGHEGDAPLAAFSPRKTALTLYFMLPDERRKELLAKLGKHKTGKGCVYVNKLSDIDTAVLKEMIREDIAHAKQLYGGEAADKTLPAAASVAKRLGFEKFQKRAVLGKERAVADDFAELDSYDTDVDAGKYDLIFSYVLTLEELKARVRDTITHDRLNPEGYLYIAYPKIGNKTYDTSVHRDAIFPSLGVDDGNGYVGDSTLKFARMVKLDDTFTLVGLKNAVKGKGKATKASSGNVADYEKFIPDVKEYLDAEHPKTAKFYAELTPGYQRDWARYIYSAKQPATQEKRKTEMLDILGKGHKTKNLYQQWLREQE
ncbi:Hypothetical protein TFLO_1402 [Trichococcus flocculiformis]|uniref:Bacteriocin-protection, YdeI or OmpD-Associated n=1 Tax=Trichococcus flocculiformis TaxID=82803 RepID=A0AB38BGV7_9LACT|nr:YdeI/OmpD-associated family protein [Trichococcus flocculiformis]CZQ91223.1 Hypothetical protein TFLO_1402 [Trichococcus flocculiformis]SFH69106.1 Bacteriocin-protection, YdeI or OmpD-Associated [Trichococcus flocculiformis]